MPTSSVKIAYATRTAVATTGMDSLATSGLSTSDAIDNSTNLYEDYLVEVFAASITPSGDQMLFIYCSSSLDGTNYSKTDSGNLGALAFLGHLPLINTGGWRSKAFSVAAAFKGRVPPYFKVHVFNSAGATLAASGNTIYQTGVYRTVG